MVKHPWPLLEISLSDFRGLATLNINTYLPRMNIEKTKSMILSRNDENRQMNLKLNGESLDQVNRFTYLGQLLVSDDGIKRRIEIARGAFRSMSNTLTSRDLSIK